MGKYYTLGPPRHVWRREEKHCISYEKCFFFFQGADERRGNMAAFAAVALAITILTDGRLEEQNITQSFVYPSFSFACSSYKNAFSSVSGQFQIGLMKLQFQFPNKSKTK